MLKIYSKEELMPYMHLICKRFTFLINSSFVECPEQKKIIIISSTYNKYFKYKLPNKRSNNFEGFVYPNFEQHICYPGSCYAEESYYSFENQMEMINYHSSRYSEGLSLIGEQITLEKRIFSATKDLMVYITDINESCVDLILSCLSVTKNLNKYKITPTQVPFQ